jgi:hypothetical protein
MLESVVIEPEVAAEGDRGTWLAARPPRPGESYSDVILRLVEVEAKRDASSHRMPDERLKRLAR